MAMTTVFAYGLIASYFIIERTFRKGDEALSLEAGECDRGSSRFILFSGLANIVLVLLAPALNVLGIGFWNSGYGCWLGISLMLL